MKSLVLLLLIVVCRGAILRDLSVDISKSQEKAAPRVVGEYSTSPGKQHDTSSFDQSFQLSRPLNGQSSSVQSSSFVQQLNESPLQNPIDLGKQLQEQQMQEQLLEGQSRRKTYTKIMEQIEPSRQSLKQLKQLDLPVHRVVGIDAPWVVHYTKPETFLNYMQTFKQKPWTPLTTINVDSLDFKTFRGLMQFPGGEFLQEEIDRYIPSFPENVLPIYRTSKYEQAIPLDTDLPIDIDNVKDVRDLLPYIVQKLEKVVPRYMEIIEDPATAALLVARDIVKVVIQGRMQCSTTARDKYFIENVHAQLAEATNDNEYHLLENFGSLMPRVLPIEPDVTDQLMNMLTREIQQQVDKDVMQYAHGVRFNDVAMLSHKLYHKLERLFTESWNEDVPTFKEQLINTVSDVITPYRSCPTLDSYQTNDKCSFACWDFHKLFSEREVARIYTMAMYMVDHFLQNTCNSEECMQYNPEIADMLQTTIKQYIHTIVQCVNMCQRTLCENPAEYIPTDNMVIGTDDIGTRFLQ